MLGTMVNVIAIVIGSLLGLLLKKGIPEKLSDLLMKGMALCVMYIGIAGTLKGTQTLLLVISVTIGSVIGHFLDLDERLNRLGMRIQNRFSGKSGSRLAEGFVNASLLFCVGAMAVTGSIDAGLSQNYDTLFTKSMIDGTTAVIFGSQFGIGTCLSAIAVFLYQGTITLLSHWVAPLLTEGVIAEVNCCGSVLITGIAFNMLGVTKLKIMNYIPSVLIAALLAILYYRFFPISA